MRDRNDEPPYPIEAISLLKTDGSHGGTEAAADALTSAVIPMTCRLP
jgi:hypothetical protein